MNDQTSERIDIDEQITPAEETSRWAWILLILIALSGVVLWGIIYLTATGQQRAP